MQLKVYNVATAQSGFSQNAFKYMLPGHRNIFNHICAVVIKYVVCFEL